MLAYGEKVFSRMDGLDLKTFSSERKMLYRFTGMFSISVDKVKLSASESEFLH